MGLDTYAYHGTHNEHLPDHLFEHIPALCQGICGSQHSGFSGKVYAHVVEEITGYSLYAEWLCADQVKQMATRFQDWLLVPRNYKTYYANTGVSERELRSLAEWFSVVAENGGRVHGWW